MARGLKVIARKHRRRDKVLKVFLPYLATLTPGDSVKACHAYFVYSAEYIPVSAVNHLFKQVREGMENERQKNQENNKGDA